MKRCNYCGASLHDETAVCPYCRTQQPVCVAEVEEDDDKSSFGWGLLGFLIPLVGLILYVVWESKRPLRAKSVGKGALIRFILNVIVNVLLFLAYFALLLMISNMYGFRW